MNSKQREEALTLELLQAIEERSDVTQRHLARNLGVALGLANSYLRRCIRKGLVKIQQAPANRYLYYLTPKGFAEKSRLTGEYLSFSLSFYRRASDSCAEILEECIRRGVTRVGLYGASDLAEIAALRAHELALDICCVCDPQERQEQFLGIPVVRCIDDAPAVDVWMVTGLSDPLAVFEQLSEHVDPEAVMVPSILGFAPRKTAS